LSENNIGKLKLLEFRELGVRNVRYKNEMVSELKESLELGKLKTASLEKMPTTCAYVMIDWAFETSSQSGGYGFPFDRPHFEFYKRLKVLYSKMKQISNIHLRDEIKDNRPFYRITNLLLENVINDKELTRAAKKIEEKISVFDNLREALRIALPDGKEGLNDDGDEDNIKTIKQKVKELRHWITTDEKLSKKTDYKKMVEQIDKYWEKLFADPIAVKMPDGQVIMIQPQRTNNILERFFRYLKWAYRKKSGKTKMAKTLKAILADTPLVKNLENQEYMKIILNDCSTLEERFAKIDCKLVWEEMKRIQNNNGRRSPNMVKIIKEPNLPQKICQLFIEFKNENDYCRLPN